MNKRSTTIMWYDRDLEPPTGESRTIILLTRNLKGENSIMEGWWNGEINLIVYNQIKQTVTLMPVHFGIVGWAEAKVG